MKQTNAKEWSEILFRVESLGQATAKHQLKATELAVLLKYMLFELIRNSKSMPDIVPNFYEYLDDQVEGLDEAAPSSANTKFCIAGIARWGWRVGYYDEENRKLYFRDKDGSSLDYYYERILSCNGKEYVIDRSKNQLIDLNAYARSGSGM